MTLQLAKNRAINVSRVIDWLTNFIGVLSPSSLTFIVRIQPGRELLFVKMANNIEPGIS
jgi:hypothetical protein